MTLLIKFAIVFAAIGLAISLGFGFWSGNSLTHVLVTALICTILSAAIGAGVYQTLKARVPEVLEIFEFSGGADVAGDDGGVSEFASDELAVGAEEGDLDSTVAAGLDGDTDLESEGAGKAQNFGDHILVENVKIKNEPKLMAQAIKTLLGKDD